VSVDFTGAEGSLPIESGGSRFVSVNPSGFSAFYSATLSDPFSFQSVSLLFDVPAGYNESFTSIVPSIAFSFSADPVFPNPGAWAGFQPVTPNQIPEPSTLSLLSIAIGLIALRKRRLQARRMGKPQS
jgi:hypothetical protein